jgi:hypothetical protein
MTRAIAAVSMAFAILASSALPAFADHTHVLQLPDGRCVILAEKGREKYVEMPNTDEFEANRRHPLHAKVHLGEPGTRRGESVIYVKGSGGDVENCDSYANGQAR